MYVMDGLIWAAVFAIVGWTLAITVYVRRRAFCQGFEALVANNPHIYGEDAPSPFAIRVGFWMAWSFVLAFAVLFSAATLARLLG